MQNIWYLLMSQMIFIYVTNLSMNALWMFPIYHLVNITDVLCDFLYIVVVDYIVETI